MGYGNETNNNKIDESFKNSIESNDNKIKNNGYDQIKYIVLGKKK